MFLSGIFASTETVLRLREEGVPRGTEALAGKETSLLNIKSTMEVRI